MSNPPKPIPSKSLPGERLAKVMARAGLCSRRDAEAWIRAGRVEINGKVVLSPALNVTDKDEIAVDGTPLASPKNTRLWLYYKPTGLVTTHKDPQGRPTVFSALPDTLPRVMSVGRLDLNSEGLLLLTNDGKLAGILENPASRLQRHYKVRVFGKIDENKLQKLKEGAMVHGIQYGPIEAQLTRAGNRNSWLQVRLAEGKNREIRKVMTSLGLQVNRLIRMQYGPFHVGKMRPGELVEVQGKELKHKLGDIYALST